MIRGGPNYYNPKHSTLTDGQRDVVFGRTSNLMRKSNRYNGGRAHAAAIVKCWYARAASSFGSLAYFGDEIAKASLRSAL